MPSVLGARGRVGPRGVLWTCSLYRLPEGAEEVPSVQAGGRRGQWQQSVPQRDDKAIGTSGFRVQAVDPVGPMGSVGSVGPVGPVGPVTT